MTNPRPTARSYSAAANVSGTASPLDWGDKCFLCSRVINIDTPPVDSREFYVSKNGGMYLCHSDCITKMHQRGGTPADFHRGAADGEVGEQPQQEDIKPPTQEQGPGWLHFEKVADYNAFVRQNTISEDVKVTVGNSVLQAGG